MLDIFSQYATDPKSEQKGKPFDFGGGVTLIIARAHNAKYSRMLSNLYDAHKHTLDQKDTEEQLAEAKRRSNLIMAEVMAHSVLLGWTGPLAYKGEVLPYSVANAKMILEHEEFQREVAVRAGDFKNFRFEVEEKDVKNSVTTSSGTAPGVESLPSLSN
jgi:hypothetical protein